MNIMLWRYVNDITPLSINKELLADVDVTLQRGVVHFTWHFNVFHLKMQAARNVRFIKDNYTENVNITIWNDIKISKVAKIRNRYKHHQKLYNSKSTIKGKQQPAPSSLVR